MSLIAQFMDSANGLWKCEPAYQTMALPHVPTTLRFAPPTVCSFGNDEDKFVLAGQPDPITEENTTWQSLLLTTPNAARIDALVDGGQALRYQPVFWEVVVVLGHCVSVLCLSGNWTILESACI